MSDEVKNKKPRRAAGAGYMDIARLETFGIHDRKFLENKLRKAMRYAERYEDQFMQLEEAEQMTLGGILIHTERLAVVKNVLKPEDFRYEKHRMIYRAMLDMARQNILIDVYNLWCFINDCGQLDKVGRASYLSYLCQIAWRC